MLELFGGLIQGWIMPLLGSIAAHYDVSGSAVSWVLTVGLLSSAVSVPLLAVIADRFGRKRILVIAVALTAVGSLLIALAPTFPLVLLGAVIQGPVAVLLPLEMALLNTLRPQAAKRIIGYLVGCLSIGIAIGAVLGGLVMDAVQNLPVVQLIPAVGLVLLILATAVFVPADSGDRTRSVDWAGAGTLGVALIGIMFGLSEGAASGWASLPVLLSLGVGVVAFVAFVLVEVRARTPLVDVSVIRNGGLAVPLVVAFLVSVALFGNQTPSTLYLTAVFADVGYGAGVSPGGVGLITGVTALLSAAASFFSVALASRIGERITITTGCLLMAAGSAGFLLLPREVALVLLLSALSAAGAGLVIGVLPGIVVSRAPVAAAASVSGLYNTVRTLGGSLAGAFVAYVLATVVLTGGAADAPAVPAAGAFQTIWGAFAALTAVAGILVLTLRRKPATPGERSTTTATEGIPA